MKPVINYNPMLLPAVIDIEELSGLPLVSGGRKVQAVFRLPDENRLHAATDRIGAFDMPHLTEAGLPAHYPGKGVILNQMALWGRRIASQIMPTDALSLEMFREQILAEFFDRCSGHVQAEDFFDVEFITRTVCEGSMGEKVGKVKLFQGHELPGNLMPGSVLAYPYFTPSGKAAKGQKDPPLTIDEYYEVIPDRDIANYLYGMAVLLHLLNRAEAIKRGMDRPDQKMEFGRFGRGKLLPRANKWLYKSSDDLAALFSSLCVTGGMDKDAWKLMPKFDFEKFYEFWFWNDRTQMIGLGDEYGGTDDGRYRLLESTRRGRELVAAGFRDLGKVFLEDFYCKEFFRIASKGKGGGYAEEASKSVKISEAVLQETGRRNLRAMLMLTSE